MADQKVTQTTIPEAESLEKTSPSGKMTLDQLEKEERRVHHVQNDFDAFEYLRDIRFEKLLFAGGMGLLIALCIIGFIFYNTVEVREQQQTVAAQVETEFYANLLKDKDYVFSFALSGGTNQYDPLSGVVEDTDSVGRLASASQGGFRIVNGEHAQIIDGDGEVALELGDDAIHIDTILVAPDGNSVVFDVKPANEQAENKYGLRLGAYEYKVGDEKFETLVSDASLGIDEATYLTHFIQILSFSPNGRYLAYTNDGWLKLYDRLSSASVNIAELDEASQQPDTGWAERPLIQAELEPSS